MPDEPRYVPTLRIMPDAQTLCVPVVDALRAADAVVQPRGDRVRETRLRFAGVEKRAGHCRVSRRHEVRPLNVLGVRHDGLELCALGVFVHEFCAVDVSDNTPSAAVGCAGSVSLGASGQDWGCCAS